MRLNACPRIVALYGFALTAAAAGGVGDVAVNVNSATLYKLKAADGTILWGPIAQSNDGQIGVDPLDFGVYTGLGGHSFGGSATIYKLSGVDGSPAWNFSFTQPNRNICGAYYGCNGGFAVDTTSAAPGVVCTEGGCDGYIVKFPRTGGSKTWGVGTWDLNGPAIDPTNGTVYAIDSSGFNVMESVTAAGVNTEASVSGVVTQGVRPEVNPADGNLYYGQGTTLYNLNKAALGTANWSTSLAASLTGISALGVQPYSGGYIYVGDSGSAKIVVFNPATRTVVRTFPVTVTPSFIAVNPAGGNIYVAGSAGNFVYAYSVTGALLWTSPNLGGAISSIAVPRNFAGTAPNPDLLRDVSLTSLSPDSPTRNALFTNLPNEIEAASYVCGAAFPDDTNDYNSLNPLIFYQLRGSGNNLFLSKGAGKIVISCPSDNSGDVAANPGSAAIYKLKAADGTVRWGPIARANDGQIGADPLDFGVYTGLGGHSFGGSATVYKLSGVDGSPAWNFSFTQPNRNICGAYYGCNGGFAVDTTSAAPGVVCTEGGCDGYIVKFPRTGGSKTWGVGTYDLNGPAIDPSNGTVYAIDSAGYSLIESVSTIGGYTEAALSGVTTSGVRPEVNPADGNLYYGQGTTLYNLNKAALGTANWSTSLAASLTGISALGVQPYSGGYIYVGDSGSAKIVVFNPATRTVVRTFPVAVTPSFIAVNPAGGNVYVAGSAGNFVYAYSVTGALLWTSPNLGGAISSIAAPRNFAGYDSPPAGLTYSVNPAAYTVGAPITNNVPSIGGGAVIFFYVSPVLPAGLSLDPKTGIISGIPTSPSGATGYTVTAVNAGGSASVVLTLSVNAAAAGPGDVAVDVGNTLLYKLKAADGTIAWGPVSRTNCGGIAVDPVDYGVYTGATGNCGGGSGVYKFDTTGAQAWNYAGYAACGVAGAYYIGTGGIAVDRTSATPGILLAMSGYYGNFGKINLTGTATLWCNGTNDLGRPAIDPANGQSYVVTNAGSYNTLYTETTGGTQSSVASCQGFTDLNPADGMLYRGGNAAATGCGLNLSQLNKASLGTPNWTMPITSVSTFDSLALQPWSGGYIYIGSVTDSKITVIDPATQTVVRTFSTIVAPAYMAVNPTGGNIFITNNSGHFVYAYSPTGTLVWTSPDLGGVAYGIATAKNVVGGP